MRRNETMRLARARQADHLSSHSEIVRAFFISAFKKDAFAEARMERISAIDLNVLRFRPPGGIQHAILKQASSLFHAFEPLLVQVLLIWAQIRGIDFKI